MCGLGLKCKQVFAAGKSCKDSILIFKRGGEQQLICI